MGNQFCCSVRSKDDNDVSGKRELQQIYETLKYYSEQQTETKGTNKVNEKVFERLFNENPTFGIKLFKFFQSQCDQQALLPIDQLTQLSKQEINKLFLSVLPLVVNRNSLGTFEMLTLVITDNYQAFTRSLKELDLVFITLSQGTYILNVKIVELIFKSQAYYHDTQLLHYKKNDSIRFQACESHDGGHIQQIFFLSFQMVEQERALKFSYLIREMEIQLPFLNMLLQAYFAQKLLQCTFDKIKIPKLLNDSYILTLTHHDLHQKDSFSLVYSSVKEQLSFEQFSQSLINAGDQSLIVMIFEDQADNIYSSSKQRYAFAGYNKSCWVVQDNDWKFCQDQIVYQLSPQFHVYNNEVLKKTNVFDDKEFPTNYFNFVDYYSQLNSNRNEISHQSKASNHQAQEWGEVIQQYKTKQYVDVFTQNYLFWIDQDIAQQSYCVPHMSSEAQSYIMKPYQLLVLEVWKCGQWDVKFGFEDVNTVQRSTTNVNLAQSQLQASRQNKNLRLDERATWGGTKSVDGSPLKRKKNLKVHFKLEGDLQSAPLHIESKHKKTALDIRDASLNQGLVQTPQGGQVNDSQTSMNQFSPINFHQILETEQQETQSPRFGQDNQIEASMRGRNPTNIDDSESHQRLSQSLIDKYTVSDIRPQLQRPSQSRKSVEQIIQSYQEKKSRKE